MPIFKFVWLACVCAAAAAQTTNSQLMISDNCRTINESAVALLHQGRLAEGQAAFRSNLAADSVKKEPVCLAVTLHNWAAILVAAGKTSDAEAPATQSVALLDKLTGLEDPARLRPLQTLWFVYSELGEVARARQACRVLRALRLLSPRDKATVLSVSAAQAHLEGQNVQAENGYFLAISAWEPFGRDGSIETASLLCGLSNLYADQDRLIDAETMMTRAVRTISTAPGATPAEVMRIRNQQAVVRARQGHWDVACSELKELVASGESSQLGSSLLKVLYSNYAYVLQKTHQKKAARAMAARAAAIPEIASLSELVDISAFTNRKGPR